MELINVKGIEYTKATELYVELGVKRDYSNWIKQSIERAELECDKDFTPFKAESTGGRPTIEYLLTRDSALTITMMSGGQFASRVRKYLIDLYKKHETGKSFTDEQFLAFMDLSRAMTLISIQKQVEKKHYAIYNDKYTWYKYRATLLGFNTDDVINAMRKVNKKHHSTRASLIKMDSNELIRTGVIDFLMCLGKSKEYATNVGDLCKQMSEKMKLGNIIWDDTKENPLQINQGEVNERKQLLDKSTKALEP
jgi:phage anti-repressor protein